MTTAFSLIAFGVAAAAIALALAFSDTIPFLAEQPGAFDPSAPMQLPSYTENVWVTLGVVIVSVGLGQLGAFLFAVITRRKDLRDAVSILLSAIPATMGVGIGAAASLALADPAHVDPSRAVTAAAPQVTQWAEERYGVELDADIIYQLLLSNELDKLFDQETGEIVQFTEVSGEWVLTQNESLNELPVL